MILKKIWPGPLWLVLWVGVTLSPIPAWAQDETGKTPEQTRPGIANDAPDAGDVEEIIKRAQAEGRALTPQEAVKVLTAEAGKGNAKAMLNLGTFYERGYGVSRHMGAALFWYQKAAAKGLAQGYYNTGVAYEIGIGATPNMLDAVANYEKASQAGLALADYKLANLYYQGEGVKKSESKALEYLLRAAEAGHPQANSDLGGIYHQGLWGQTKDLPKAAGHIRAAAEAGLPEAMKNMAILYLNGEGVDRDLYQAAKWCRLAQMAGYPGLDQLVQETKAALSEERTKKLEEEIRNWVAEYNKKNDQDGAGQPISAN